MVENDAPRRDAGTAGITSSEAFWETIRETVLEADSNGVDVRGGWSVVQDDGQAWDVAISDAALRSHTEVADGESIASVIVRAVAEREGVDAFDLPSLQETINYDILVSLVEDGGDPDQHVRFDYCGYGVTVHADGMVFIDS